MHNEPVRGRVPDPSVFSLSGLEILRTYMRGLMPATPLFRLLGPRVTQVSSGTAVLQQTISPWLQVNEDFVDLTPTADYILYVTALTGAPPASALRTVNVSLRYLRPCTTENEIVIARGRIVHAGSSFTTVEALIEDSLGRAVAHAMGSVTVELMDPPPPPFVTPDGPPDEPVYSTPDPVNRPIDERHPDGTLPVMPPFGRFFGARYTAVTDAQVDVEMPASEWFCMLRREVVAGVVGLLGNLSIRQALANVLGPDERFVIVEANTTQLAPVAADGHLLHARGALRHRRGDMVVPEAQITDEDGRLVATVGGTCLIRSRATRFKHPPPDRVLLTVLFTDLVDSTARARELGDTRWRELLDEHNALLRRALDRHRGREVKTTGDGFLATFDSPSRAVRCAVDARQGLAQLGLEMRAGIHTGECEVVGRDIAGLAVHIAARVQACAGTGEILVSSTVRDLLAAADFSLVDRGAHELKGLDGTWTLSAVEV